MFEQPAPEIKPKKIPSQTLGEQYFKPQSLDNQLLKKPDLQQLRDEYAALLPLVKEPEIKQIVRYRLADLSGVLAEQAQESGQVIVPSQQTQASTEQKSKAPAKVFDSAIQQYQALLAEHPTHDDNMQVLYQLAKAYEQQGEIEQSYSSLQQLLKAFPQNPYLAEVYFRLGEIEYNRGQFAAAIKAYQQVIVQGAQSAYYSTSAYMLGWSYFKNNQNSAALGAFTLLLDDRLPSDIIARPMLAQVDSQAQIDALGLGQKRLVNDTLRIMSLLFSYQQSQFESPADSIETHFAQVGSRHYEYVLYDQLAQLYLNQGRFKDSAKVYQGFSLVNPQHFQAPILAVKEIDVYILGKFPSEVLPAKQRFVERYGMSGEYWPQWGVLQQELVAPFLNQYLLELAHYEHSRGQLLDKQVVDKQVVDKQIENKQAAQAYLAAALWYQEFIETFPFDPQQAEVRFSLGEAYASAGHKAQAIEVFEAYAYGNEAYAKAAEAAYAAILAYRQIQLQGGANSPFSQEQWLDLQLISQDNFVTTFATDDRAKDVLYISMQQLFELQRYPLAIEQAQRLLNWPLTIPLNEQNAAKLVIAHSQFAIEDYAAAERSYQDLLVNLALDDPRLSDLQERLAASIYKQAELHVAQNYLPLAVSDFLRVLAKTPDTSIRIKAQYDAATYLLEMQEWQQAIDLLEDFRQRFKQHVLSADIGDKLIVAYQQNESWQQAASELTALWQKNPDSEEGRQALYVAAQYYYKVGNSQQALSSYRDYAHRYPLPLAEANEARFILSEIYLKAQDDEKRRFWLNKLIEGDKQALQDITIERSERSRYLAAMSSLVFAQDRLVGFKNIQLSLPLKTSLARKKQALEQSLAAFNQVLDYKVEEFNTAANFYLGDIYHQLAKDLMASSKPKDLNALELEQYELLLEEQAFPFEEQAITLHETNAKRAWQGTYDKWVQESFNALKTLMPARYLKVELSVEAANDIY
ncbi:tetratricopeptide repeat protein [Paraglaciecola hydrolytica]|nr:tetratricopeptide repeat protein [Paraglaciecola hydrolytica]